MQHLYYPLEFSCKQKGLHSQSVFLRKRAREKLPCDGHAWKLLRHFAEKLRRKILNQNNNANRFANA